MEVSYILIGVWVTYLGLGRSFITLSCSFFGYLLIFLYLFSTHLWQSVLLTKNFNLKYILNTKIVQEYSFLVTLVAKKKYTF